MRRGCGAASCEAAPRRRLTSPQRSRRAAAPQGVQQVMTPARARWSAAHRRGQLRRGACLALGAQVRARTGRESRQRARQRREGPHPARRRQGLRQAGDGGRRAGRRRRPRCPRCTTTTPPRSARSKSSRSTACRRSPARDCRPRGSTFRMSRSSTRADITDLEALRGSLKEKAAAAGVKVTPLAFIIAGGGARDARIPDAQQLSWMRPARTSSSRSSSTSASRRTRRMACWCR